MSFLGRYNKETKKMKKGRPKATFFIYSTVIGLI